MQSSFSAASFSSTSASGSATLPARRTLPMQQSGGSSASGYLYSNTPPQSAAPLPLLAHRPSLSVTAQPTHFSQSARSPSLSSPLSPSASGLPYSFPSSNQLSQLSHIQQQQQQQPQTASVRSLASHTPTVAFSIGKREIFTPSNGFKTISKKLRQRGFRVVTLKSPITPAALKLESTVADASATTATQSASASFAGASGASETDLYPASQGGRGDTSGRMGQTRQAEDPNAMKEPPEIVVIGSPREKFSQGEFTTLKLYLDSATPTNPRSIIYLALEGGESGLPSTSLHPWTLNSSPSSSSMPVGSANQSGAIGGDSAGTTNFNYLLEELGVVVQPDAVVRASYARRPVGGAAVSSQSSSYSAAPSITRATSPSSPTSPPRPFAVSATDASVSVPPLPPQPTHHYYHPKEVLVQGGVLNRGAARAALVVRGYADMGVAGAGTARERASGGMGTAAGQAQISFVYPFGATLVVQRPSVPLLSTGTAAVPLARPVVAAWESPVGIMGAVGAESRAASTGTVTGTGAGLRGGARVVVCGSAAMFSDGYVEKEWNAAVWEVMVGWCAGGGVGVGGAVAGNGVGLAGMMEGSKIEHVVWNAIDAGEPDLCDPHPAPALPSLASTPRPCLDSGTEDLPRDFARLFAGGVFGFDPPRRVTVGGEGHVETVTKDGDIGVGGMVGAKHRKSGPMMWKDLYSALRLPAAPLTLIHPTFETPLPALQPAVFPPVLREPPPPPLELFDLDEEFMEWGQRLGEIGGKCTNLDLEYYILACGDILGVSEKLWTSGVSDEKPSVGAKGDPEQDARKVLEHVLKALVAWKRNDIGLMVAADNGGFEIMG
ncbi:Intraflagellar transport protein 52 [Gonapodya sp. JEL0774]|nr:Intraflagellar transport protein 52 [Gonapodya sp. JEL0774]